MADRSISVRLRADVADFRQGLRQASGELDSFVQKANKNTITAESSGARLVQSMKNQREAWDTAGRAMMVFGAGTATALAGSVKAASDWESAFAGVRKTVDTTVEGYAALSDGLRQMARELPASHAEIAGVAEAAGQLGISEGNILSFTRTMIDMGEATNLSANEAATTLAKFANIMGTSQAQFSNLGSSIVSLGNNFATTESDIANMALRLASAGRQIGLTEGDVLGIATALSSVGIEAEAGGSAFSRVMLGMRKAVDTGSDALNVFARTAGMSTQEFARAFRENAGQALTAFISGLGQMEAAGQSTQPILEALGMTDIRVGNALRSSASAADLFAEAMRLGNEAYGENTALADEAAQRYETFQSQLGMLKNSLVEVGISIGQTLLPVLKLVVGGVSWVANAFADLPAPIQAVLGGLGGLVSAASLVGGGFLLLAPRILEGVEAFRRLRQANIPLISKSIEGLGGVAGKVGPLLGKAGLAGAAIAAGAAFLSFADDLDYANAGLLDTATILDRLHGWKQGDFFEGLFGGKAVSAYYKDLETVFDNLANPSFYKHVENSLWGLIDGTGFRDMKRSIEELDNAFKTLDPSSAAARFRQLWQEAGGTEEAFNNIMKAMPGLKAKLESAAEAAGVTKDPLAMMAWLASDAADASEGLAGAVSEVKEASDDAAAALDEYLEFVSRAAGVAISADEAQIQYAKTLREAQGLLESTAYKEATLTEQQEMRTQALIDVSKRGWESVQALYAEDASAESLAASHQQLVNDLYATALQMGLNEEAAWALTQRYAGIPKDIKSKAEFDDYVAKLSADELLNLLNTLNGKTTRSTHLHTTQYITTGDTTHAIRTNGTGGSYSSSSGRMRAEFWGGGYTGPGGVLEPAGIVHKGEVVWSQRDIARAGGVAVVEAMRLGLRGYQAGGIVQSPAPHVTRPVINVATPSLDGMRIEGALQVGDALVPLIDGRIVRREKQRALVRR